MNTSHAENVLTANQIAFRNGSVSATHTRGKKYTVTYTTPAGQVRTFKAKGAKGGLVAA